MIDGNQCKTGSRDQKRIFGVLVFEVNCLAADHSHVLVLHALRLVVDHCRVLWPSESIGAQTEKMAAENGSSESQSESEDVPAKRQKSKIYVKFTSA